jgi:hypothetical protein
MIIYNISYNKMFWVELIANFPLTRQGPHRKRRLQQFFPVAGTSLLSCSVATIRGYTDSPSIGHDLIEHDASNCFSIVAYIRCCENVFTEPLPSNDGRDAHMDTQTHERDL